MSRTSISPHAQRVEQAVVHEQAGGISDEALWAENERLRAENEALPDRSGDSGCERLAKWPDVARVIAEAGKGLERGVQLANATRAAEAEAQGSAAAIPIAMGLDVCHTPHELQRGLHRPGRQAERPLEAASIADAKVERSQQRGRDARGAARQAGGAWRKAERLFDEAVVAEAAAERVEEALARCRPEGCLNDRQWAQAHLRDATEPLTGQEGGKVRRVRSEQRTLTHLDWTHEQRAQSVAEPLWREAVVRLWSLRDAMTPTHGQQRARLEQLAVLEQLVWQRLCGEWQLAYARVAQMLGRGVWARSAVEGGNSVMRMHQARHRHVSQGMRDLKRLDWHCRLFRHGKREGDCPYELLGLKLPTYDWWTLLRLDPKELEQQLLTQEVMV